MAQLSGKTALVTGASVGLGRDLAELFAADGHHLVISARNCQQLEDLAGKLRSKHGVNVEVIPKDLSMPCAPKEIFDAISSKGIAIEYLINNAGFGSYGLFVNSDLAQQLAIIQVNIAATTHLTRLFLPAMMERRSGRIMNVGSMAGFVPGPFMATYYASKAFLLSFSLALAAEMKEFGITVTDLCPGPTETEFQKRAGIRGRGESITAMLDSMTVARAGYRAMMSGKGIELPGFVNRMMIFGTRFAPRKFVAKQAWKINRDR